MSSFLAPFMVSVGTLLAAFPSHSAERIAGRAEVIDGDTIAVEGIKARIRLFGVDAPESKQTCDDSMSRRYLCGSRAAVYLAQIIGRNGRVTCHEEDQDRYGRIVATCMIEMKDIGREMVLSGWAMDYPAYSKGRYADAEISARDQRRGAWAGSWQAPWQWRADRSALGRRP